MNSKGSGSIATLLFSIPLAAIPLMAIFGIPQFAPLTSPPSNEIALGDPTLDRDFPRRASELNREPGDRFAEADAPPFDRRREPGRRATGDFSDEYADGARSNSQPLDRRVRPAGLSEPWPGGPESTRAGGVVQAGAEIDRARDAHGAATRSPSSPHAEGSSLTWREAARKFSELGIGNYHLEPGGDEGLFLFVCTFAPQAGNQIVMRFEAESEDPLLAVENVLGQLDRWTRQQRGDSHREPSHATP